MGACGREHADRSMPMGWCDQKGEGKKSFVLLSVFRLHICTGMESCRREHADHMDESLWMGVWGQEHCDRSNFFLTIFF